MTRTTTTGNQPAFAQHSSPDPSVLTTQQLWREVESLKELVFTKIDGIETAVKVAHEDLVRVPTDVQKQVGNLRELHDEKFVGVQKQFDERDIRTQKIAELNQKAIEAALQTARDAVEKQQQSNTLSIAKSEAAITKQIDLQGVLIDKTTKATEDKVADLKERLTILEASLNGRQQGVEKSQQRFGANYGMIIGAIIAVGVLFALIEALIRMSGR